MKEVWDKEWVLSWLSLEWQSCAPLLTGASEVGCGDDIPHISNTERGKPLDFATYWNAVLVSHEKIAALCNCCWSWPIHRWGYCELSCSLGYPGLEQSLLSFQQLKNSFCCCIVQVGKQAWCHLTKALVLADSFFPRTESKQGAGNAFAGASFAIVDQYSFNCQFYPGIPSFSSRLFAQPCRGRGLSDGTGSDGFWSVWGVIVLSLASDAACGRGQGERQMSRGFPASGQRIPQLFGRTEGEEKEKGRLSHYVYRASVTQTMTVLFDKRIV